MAARKPRVWWLVLGPTGNGVTWVLRTERRAREMAKADSRFFQRMPGEIVRVVESPKRGRK